MPTTATPPPELHLPDLPEVPVTLPVLPRAGGTERRKTPFGLRLREALSTYLPLLLMAMLASGTWWLVKNTPLAEAPGPARPLRHEPDYTMQAFSLTRFAADGRFALRIEGDVLRHYPDTDRIEIDGARIHAVSPDGRVTRATAKLAVSNADASEVQLQGGARVVVDLAPDDRLEVESEFLHAFLRFERVRSHLPVLVKRGAAVTHAEGLDYDHLQRELKLLGTVRASLPPNTGRAGAS